METIIAEDTPRTILFLEEGARYIVESNIKHKVIRDNQDRRRGITISKNGEEGFTQEKKSIIYEYRHPYAVFVLRPLS